MQKTRGSIGIRSSAREQRWNEIHRWREKEGCTLQNEAVEGISGDRRRKMYNGVLYIVSDVNTAWLLALGRLYFEGLHLIVLLDTGGPHVLPGGGAETQTEHNFVGHWRCG